MHNSDPQITGDFLIRKKVIMIYLLFLILWYLSPVLLVFAAYSLYRKYSEDSENSKEIVSGMILAAGFRTLFREFTRIVYRGRRR